MISLGRIGSVSRFEKLLMTDLRKEDVNDVYVRVKVR